LLFSFYSSWGLILILGVPMRCPLVELDLQLNTSDQPPKETVQNLASIKIPRRDGEEVFAYCANHNTNDQDNAKPVLILIHEFFGLSKSICDKADALAQDLNICVVAPDTFRGESSAFIPKCIWLALSTPQDRVNQDLDDVLAWVSKQSNLDASKLAIMGFCYGGGKAIRYTTQRQPHAATVVCYGSPLTDVEELSKLQKPVCGVFGRNDAQFSTSLLTTFQESLTEANVEQDIKIYEGVGHAFWADMDQVRSGAQPQADAYSQVTGFLERNLLS